MATIGSSIERKNNLNIPRKLHAPWEIFEQKSGHFAIVVLNTQIQFSSALAPLLCDMWDSAEIRITVDGGTDRWLEWTESLQQSALKMPDLITGDMDSILPATLERFSALKETKIIYTRDQNMTDFTKALLELKQFAIGESLQPDDVVVLQDCSGRFDQSISNINTLYLAKDKLPNVNVYLLSATSLTWLIEPHILHNITIPDVLRMQQSTCGLLPIGSKSRVTTTGLKWNLNDTEMAFGQIVSTSNSYNDDTEIVSIICDSQLIWTMEISAYLHYCVKNYSKS